MSPVLHWIEHADRTVTGGQLTQEYRKWSCEFQSFLNVLNQVGKVRVFESKVIRQQLGAISEQCRSNDEHRIALVRISGARILCTHDRLLSQDVTAQELLNWPREQAYRNRSHKHLIHGVRCQSWLWCQSLRVIRRGCEEFRLALEKQVSLGDDVM